MRRPSPAPPGPPPEVDSGDAWPAPAAPPVALAVGAAALLLLAAPPPAPAQGGSAGPAAGSDPPWTASLRVGPTSARGSLGQLTSGGWIAALAVERRVLGRGLLRGETGIQAFDPGGAPETLGGEPGPEVEVYHYTVGAGVELTDPVLSRWDVSLALGAGGAYLVSGESPALADYSGNRATVRAGGRVGYDFSRSFTLYLRADLHQLLEDPSAPAPLDEAHTLLTHSAELRIGI